MAIDGTLVRDLRGERSRAEFVRDLYDSTGVGVSEDMVYHLEAGQVAFNMPDVIRALILAYPSLARVFLPSDITRKLATTRGALSETDSGCQRWQRDLDDTAVEIRAVDLARVASRLAQQITADGRVTPDELPAVLALCEHAVEVAGDCALSLAYNQRRNREEYGHEAS